MNGSYYYFEPILPALTPDEERCMRKSYSRFFLSLGIYTILALAVIYLSQIIILIVLGLDKGMEFLAGNLYIWTAQIVSMYVIAYPILWLIVWKMPRKKRERTKISLEEFVTLFLISEAVMLIGSTVSTTVTSVMSCILGYEIKDTTSELIMNSPEWVIILVAVVIGPIFEELIFRKLFIDRASVYGDRLAVIVSAISFGLFHGNLSQLLYAGALGLILGYLYVKTRDVRLTALLHILINFVGTAPAVFAKDSIAKLEELAMSETISEADAVAILGDSMAVMGISLVQYVLAALGIAALVIVLKRGLLKLPDNTYERVGENGTSEYITVPAGQAVKCVLLSVGAILFAVTVIIQFVFSILPS